MLYSPVVNDSVHRPRHLVLWDGDCGFCRRIAAWFTQRDRRGEFELIPYQKAPSPPMTAELRAACERAMHVVKSDGEILVGGKAMLFLFESTGCRTVPRVLSLPPFSWFVELAYRVVASNRRFFSRFMFRRG